MQFPNLAEYVEAIRNAEDNFDKLSHLRPVMDNHDEPYRSVGGFAVVFKMKDVDTGREYAIKCFHQDQDNRAHAYEEISKELRNNRSPYLMEVNYLPKELFVDTNISNETEFPVLQMDWVDGETMETYIASHYRDTAAIKDLYKKICDLALWLRTKPFAHGDIKPDNIMIKPDGSLILVDYDGMYVKALSGMLSPTTGTKGFSHPLRTGNDFDENIDDFALASMSISLLAMSEDGNLFKDFSSPDRLLFSHEDYQDFYNSNVYNKLKLLGGLFPKLLDLFGEILKKNDTSNKSLYDQIFDLQTKAPKIEEFVCVNGTTIYVEDEVSFNWKVSNATQVFINGIDVTENTTYKDKPNKDKEYVIRVSNGLKENTQTLSIKVIAKPTIKLNASSTKLKKGKENKVRITWIVTHSDNVTFTICNQEESVKNSGEKQLQIDNSTEVKITAIGKDGKRKFTKSVRISSFNESNVEFTADKLYSLPNVPITLSWNVEHAKEIELDGHGKVKPQGSIVISPKNTETYRLKVTDAFGTREHELKIQMLPLPHVKALNIPTPQFSNTMNVDVSASLPNVNISFPKINVMGVEFNAPLVPELTDLDLDVKITNRISKQINLWADLKSLYLYYRNKLFSHER